MNDIIATLNNYSVNIRKAVRKAAEAHDKARTMRLRYRDANGDYSLRHVDVTGIRQSKAGDILIVAYDVHLEEFRTFRADRFIGANLKRKSRAKG